MRTRNLLVLVLIGGVMATSCAAVREERGGPGADGVPLVQVACAEDEPDCQDTLVDSELPTGGDDPVAPPSDGSDQLSGGMVVAPLSISDAVDHHGSDVIAVMGYVVIDTGSARLCASLAESFPPQCGGDSVTITNPDATSQLPLIEEGSTQWSEEQVIVLGRMSGEVFTIDPTSISVAITRATPVLAAVTSTGIGRHRPHGNAWRRGAARARTDNVHTGGDDGRTRRTDVPRVPSCG